MTRLPITAALALSCVMPAFAAEQAKPAPPSDAKLIDSAMQAAPASVGGKAKIVAMDDKGGMRTLREGTNGFTCMPDNPTTPGNDPMCLDKAGMEWAHAWMTKAAPPAGVGFGYMLMGGSDASNDDPYATKPAAGKKWVDTGAHVMVLNPGPMADAYPKSADDPKKPYVMWPGTPYQHLMIPVK